MSPSLSARPPSTIPSAPRHIYFSYVCASSFPILTRQCLRLSIILPSAFTKTFASFSPTSSRGSSHPRVLGLDEPEAAAIAPARGPPTPFERAVEVWRQHPMWQVRMPGVDLKLHLFNPHGPQVCPQPVRRSGLLDFYSIHAGVQGDALARNNAYSALARKARWGEKHRRMGELQNKQWSRELIEPMGAAEYRRTMAELAEQ
ncbi:hypothetical protein CAEBREN_17762 [Caenorhabditis brenneri]|uniref:Uncharacterized protein n=1 Tax=Caenorhabditis brenneri TaxID=135651 RepID=G0NZL6_CAEBE|nr:hypothetical protein CAEBREN_17762 [Caenorhabditis brenneri]